MKQHRLTLTALVILHSTFSIQAVQPPELTVLRQQYDKVVAERVTAPFDAGLAELNTKYGAGLERAIGDAKAAGKLEDILAIEAEKKRLTDKLPVPTTDEDAEPEALKKFRGIYREQLAALSAKRDQSQEDLLAPYAAKLKELEAVLVKNDRVDEAKEVLAYRNGQGAPPAPVTPNPPNTAAGGPAAPPPAVPKGKGDDRKAAEWVLNNWSECRITLDTNTPIKTKDDLPKGKFAITSLAIDGRFYTGGNVTGNDLQMLAGLAQVKKLTFGNFPNLHDPDFAFLATLGALEELTLSKTGITDAVIPNLSGLRALKELGFSEIPAMTGKTLSQLSSTPLESLRFWKCGLNDEGVAGLSGCKHLLMLNISAHRLVTDASLPAIRSIGSLERLYIDSTGITPEALGAVKMPNITSLGLNALGGKKLDEIIPQVAGAFPNLTGFQISYEASSPAELAALAHFPKLDALANYGLIMDEAWPGLLELRGLRVVSQDTSRPLPAAALTTLAQLKKLKVLRTGDAPPDATALAAFKKQRPDVKVEK